MADFTAAIPVEEKKSDFLHDRSLLPSAPRPRTPDLIKRYLPIALGVAIAMGIELLAYQTRATLQGNRDWVVPVTTPFFGIGGVALGALIARNQWIAATPGILLMLLAVTLTVLNIWRGSVTDGPDVLRDVLSSVAGAMLAFSLLALLIALVWVELTRPTRAPTLEV